MSDNIDQNVIDNLTTPPTPEPPAKDDPAPSPGGTVPEGESEVAQLKAQLEQAQRAQEVATADFERLISDQNLNEVQQQALFRSFLGNLGMPGDRAAAITEQYFAQEETPEDNKDNDPVSTEEDMKALQRSQQAAQEEEVRQRVALIKYEISKNIDSKTQSDAEFNKYLDSAKSRGDNSAEKFAEKIRQFADQHTLQFIQNKASQTNQDVTADWIPEAVNYGWEQALDLARTFSVAPTTLGPSGSTEDPYRAIFDKEPTQAPELGDPEFKKKNVDHAIDQTLRNLMAGKTEI